MRSIDLSTVNWRKSSYSNPDGGQCIEVSDDFLTTAAWRKSSYSNPDGGACIEIADNHAPLIPVRDSKNPTGPALVFEAAAWASFVTSVKDRALPGA